jgi:glucose dehydrogenase
LFRYPCWAHSKQPEDPAPRRGARLELPCHQALGRVYTPYAAEVGAFPSPLEIPCSAPPWGLITAVDLVSGRVIWNKRFGTGRDSGPLGIPSELPVAMGIPNIGGPVTTRSGLVFIAATVERALHAYDIATGKEVWQARLPGGGQATPMIYRSARSGREFVVIAAGGKPSLQSPVEHQDPGLCAAAWMSGAHERIRMQPLFRRGRRC